MNEHGIQLGGEEQAWLYRQEMRAAWMATDGMRRWLAQESGSRRRG